MKASNLLTKAEPKGAPRVLDDAHLSRMTLGDASLEREVLEIFVRQAAMSLKRVAGADPSLAAAVAHTFKGSARGIGAWRVALAAERVEQAAGHGDEAALRAAVAEFEAASREACAAISVKLGAGEAAGADQRGGDRACER